MVTGDAHKELGAATTGEIFAGADIVASAAS
jgi:hypothetical protein